MKMKSIERGCGQMGRGKVSEEKRNMAPESIDSFIGSTVCMRLVSLSDERKLRQNFLCD